jgi:hypothetical protein
MTTKTALWLLPIGFILHDGEELLTMVAWMEQHRAELERRSSRSPLLSRLIYWTKVSSTDTIADIGQERLSPFRRCRWPAPLPFGCRRFSLSEPVPAGMKRTSPGFSVTVGLPSTSYSSGAPSRT